MTPALARSRQLHQKLKLGLIADIATDLHQQLEELRVNNKVGRTEAATLKDQIDMINTHLSYQQRRSRISKRLDQPTDLLMRGSTSQLGQDLWVLRNSNYKKHGFFVEFGATDGLMLSNTWLLEKDYEWQGICAEPNPHFYKQLAHNRQCITSMDCITDATGDLVEFVLADEYSGITDHAFEDSHKDKRQAFKSKGDTISLRTISLHDFLLKHDAPRDIDYISIDTEGSEYTILKAFPFEQWNVRMFSVEHNFTPQRQLIRELMTQHGYVCEEMQFDDWYVRG